jgi:hypothetical protein
MDIQLLMDLGMDGTTKLGFGAIGWRVLPTPNHRQWCKHPLRAGRPGPLPTGLQLKCVRCKDGGAAAATQLGLGEERNSSAKSRGRVNLGALYQQARLNLKAGLNGLTPWLCLFCV